MKRLLPFLLLIMVLPAFSQNWPVKQLVIDKLSRGETFTTVPVFRFSTNKQLTGRGTYQELQLDGNFCSRIMTERPATLQISIPLSKEQTITCQLVKVSLGNTVFTENNTKEIPNVKIPVTYRGIISGEQQKNNVILTVNDDYISLITTANNRTIQITQVDSSNRQIYRLYNSQQVRFPVLEFTCGTRKIATAQTPDGILLNGVPNRTETVQDKCVNVFVDCFDSLYQWRGSNNQQTINYVYELYNLVTTGYVNESINIQVIGINVWTVDPYRQTSRNIALDDLAFYYKDNFWGNICVGLDYGTTPRFGLASDVPRVKAVTPNSCPAFRSHDSTGAFAYCDQNYGGTYRKDFPTGPNVTAGQLYQVMHEIGHLLGAHHTQWCGWQLTPTTTGAIDNCGPVEAGPLGLCMPGPPPPDSNGTIMSYCNTAPNFVSYNNGFGPLPGNAIRNFVSQTDCIASCLACLDGMLYPGIDDKKQPDGRLSTGQAIDHNVETRHALSLPTYPSSRYSSLAYSALLQPIATR